MRYLIAMLFMFTYSAAQAADGSLDISPDNSSANMFHADLSHPDMKTAVTTFEDVCMPFILHQTEMTQAINRAHTEKLLASQNYFLQFGETWNLRVVVEPSRQEWKPPSQMITPSVPGHFTVFNGVSSEVVKSTQTIVSQTGEIDMRAYIPPTYKTRSIYVETYAPKGEDRISAKLGWNYPSQNDPAKTCEIHMDSPKIDRAAFADSFIDKDEDWRRAGDTWS